jgi:CopG family nickel-responsive transcriptional regulator
MVYDHDQRGLLQTLIDIQHQYTGNIQASLHSHVTHSKCLEVILVRGDGTILKDITEKLMAQKGVEAVKLTTIPIEG